MRRSKGSLENLGLATPCRHPKANVASGINETIKELNV
jgi:hypothetical protein